ncbi:unnamed protein product [Clonostachys rhizophaga]|uniref:Uncharacterized protein n=1 Tax=Clonostachys rhizophaga TaxID=160324 RepID=A0A9N9VNV5_9HYPO|nr:unnamed protein product [Clonostachys rhizophaga]
MALRTPPRGAFDKMTFEILPKKYTTVTTDNIWKKGKAHKWSRSCLIPADEKTKETFSIPCKRVLLRKF